MHMMLLTQCNEPTSFVIPKRRRLRRKKTRQESRKDMKETTKKKPLPSPTIITQPKTTQDSIKQQGTPGSEASPSSVQYPPN